MARRRAQWVKYQDRIDPSRLVFIDETWTKTNMASLRGWAPRGERIKAKVPHGHWKTMTFLAALRHDRVDAPWLIDGPINGERFKLYVDEVLVPTLKPGDIVIMDNLGSHKGKAVRRAIRSAGARLLTASGSTVNLIGVHTDYSEGFVMPAADWLRGELAPYTVALLDSPRAHDRGWLALPRARTRSQLRIGNDQRSLRRRLYERAGTV